MNRKMIVVSVLSAAAISSQAALVVDYQMNTGIATDVGHVTSWADQTPNNNNATANGIMPDSGLIGVTAQGAVNFSGQTAADSTAGARKRMLVSDAAFDSSLLGFSGTTGGFAALISFADASVLTSADGWRDIIGNSSAVSGGFFIRYNNPLNDTDGLGSLTWNLGGGDVGGGGGTLDNVIAAGDSVKAGISFDNSTGAVIFKFQINDDAVITKVGTAGQNENFSDGGLALGYNDNNGRLFEGDVGAVQFYDGALDDAALGTALNALPTVIPEPATLGLVAVFGGGVLFIRRRFMM